MEKPLRKVRFNQHYWYDVNPPRSLTRREREVLAFMLSKPFPGRDALRQQAETARVVSACSHCATIFFAINRITAPPAHVERRVPIEALGSDVDGMGVQVLLHVVDDYLDELEIWRGDLGEIMEMPEPTALYFFEWIESGNGIKTPRRVLDD